MLRRHENPDQTESLVRAFWKTVAKQAAETNVVNCKPAKIRLNFRSNSLVQDFRFATSMMSPIERSIEISFRHRVYFTRDLFAGTNPMLRDVLLNDEISQVPKSLVFLDDSLHRAQ